jgi:hypothetical protein
LTLTVEPKHVKLPRQAWLLWLASLLTAAGALTFIAATNGAEQTRSAYSQTLANSLATLSLEPFVAQDQIQLGLLCNRIGSLPHVAAVTIVDLGERVLASTGATTLPAPRADHSGEYGSASVNRDDTVLGYVRVQLQTNAFAQNPTWRHWLFGLLWALLAPVVVLGFRHWWQKLNSRSSRKVVDVEFDGSLNSSATQTFIISANLFNRLGLDTSAQKSAQALVLARAKQIAPLYGGTAQALDQAAVCMRFPDHGQDDAAFAALCAGMLWAECMQGPKQKHGQEHGHESGQTEDNPAEICAYRFGGHRLEAATGEDSNATEAEQEAQLLSAVASNGQLAISEAMLEQIDRQERLELRVAEHPLHEDLNTVGNSLYQVQGIAAHYSELLTKQAQALATQT